VFLESMTITSACNKILRKKFLLPGRIVLIPVGGYNNIMQSKKAIAWLLLEEKRARGFYMEGIVRNMMTKNAAKRG